MDARLNRICAGNRADGFTLIELLIVVAIMSVLSVTAGLTVTRLATHPPGDLRWFQTLDETLRSDALMTRKIQGLIVSDRGVRRMSAAENRQVTQTPERLWDTPPDWIEPLGPTRRISYLPDGRSTPLIVDLRDGTSIIRCTSDGWTGLKCGAR